MGFIDKHRREVVEIVLVEEHDRIAMKLNQNENNIKELIQTTATQTNVVDHQLSSTTNVQQNQLSLYQRMKKQLQSIGLLTRPLNESRMMIAMICLQAIQDVCFILLLLLLIITLIRSIPVINELWSTGTCSPMKYSTKIILIRHVKQLFQDIISLVKFTVCTIVVIVFIGGIPSYLRDLGFHLETYQIAADFAMKHAKKSIFKLFELISLLFIFRTYRILFKSCLYCLIIPGACLAEANPFVSLSASIRFIIGILAWIGLLAGSIIITCLVQQEENRYSAFEIRNSLLYICSAMFGILLISAMSVSNRSAYMKPDVHAVKSFHFNWDHILAILTGPVESIQLSAVILYFFWNHARGNSRNYDSSNHINTALGSDSFSAVILIWGNYNHHHQSNEMSGVYYNNNKQEYALHLSVMIACLFVIIWAIIVSIPLVWSSTSSSGGSDQIQNKEKVIKFKNSPIVEFLVVLLSRLLPVWIIATLMRSTSCIDITDKSSITSSIAVISTAQEVKCTQDSTKYGWSMAASLSLLMFYILTTSVLNADEADLLRDSLDRNRRSNSVKFAPLYALCIRSIQFFICTVCFTGFYTESIYIPLLPILFMSLFGSLLPLIISPCSLSIAGFMRTGGFICVIWTGIFCMLRDDANNGSSIIWESETNLYIGWGIIYFITVIIAIYKENLIKQKWNDELNNSGLLEIIELFIQVLGNISDLNVLHITHQFSFASITNKKINNNKLLAYYMNKVKNAKSPQQLARLILVIEESIMADRLSDDFLKQRSDWIKGLENLQGDLQEISSNGSLEDIRNHAVSFQNISIYLTTLRDSLITPCHTIHYTRNVFTILLSYRLPKEICWLIFEYFLISKDIHDIIISSMNKMYHNISFIEKYGNIKHSGCLMELMIKDCDHFITKQRKEISQATVSQSFI